MVRAEIISRPTREVLDKNKLWEFLVLGVPGMLMLCSEWWAYEILTMFAGVLGKEEVSAQAILMQMLSLAFMIPLGMGIASCSLVGNAMGACKITLAKKVGRLALGINVGVQLLLGAFIYAFGSQFVYVFTSDKEVNGIISDTLLFMAGFVLFDGTQGVGSGILRGVGKQNIGAFMNILAFYVIGIPLAYYLAFEGGLGVEGLIRGIFFGTLFQCIVLVYFLFWREDYIYQMKLVGTLGVGSPPSLGDIDDQGHHGDNEDGDEEAPGLGAQEGIPRAPPSGKAEEEEGAEYGLELAEV